MPLSKTYLHEASSWQADTIGLSHSGDSTEGEGGASIIIVGIAQWLKWVGTIGNYVPTVHVKIGYSSHCSNLVPTTLFGYNMSYNIQYVAIGLSTNIYVVSMVYSWRHCKTSTIGQIYSWTTCCNGFRWSVFHVKLCENDVPGVKFSYNECAAHSVIKLRRWLERRRLKTSGTEQELITSIISNLPCRLFT